MSVQAQLCAVSFLLVALAPASASWAPPATLAEALSLATGLPASEPSPRVATLAELVAQADARLGVVRPAGATDALATLDPALAEVVADLLHALLEAAAERDAAFAGVADAKILALADTEALTPAAEAILERVDAERLRVASLRLARAVDLATPRLQALAPLPVPGPALAPAPPIDLFPVLGIDPLGVANAFPRDYVLSVDLGGNDVYDNNAGGSIVFGGGFIVGDPATFGPCAAGWCVGGEYEDAAVSITASLAIDVAGDDTYGVYKTPSGKGGSRDHLCTQGPLVRRIVVQGSGSGGIGMLVDLAGNDAYRGKTLAQGNGHVQGVGVLFDATGNDRYTAIRSAQGSSVLQGVGVQVDLAGDDVHEMKAPPGGIWNVDRNRCDAGERLAMGASVIQGASLFLEASGNDVYDVDSQALGHVDAFAAAANFLDLGGLDAYPGWGGRGNGVENLTLVRFGGAPAGWSLFKDLA